MLTAARRSSEPFDFALVCLLGLLGLRIVEAVGADVEIWVRSTVTASCACEARAARVVLVPLPPAVSRAVDRAVADAGVRLPRMHPHMPRHAFVTAMLDAGVDVRDVQIAARHADPRTTRRYDRARKNLDRHPNYILAAYMASGT